MLYDAKYITLHLLGPAEMTEEQILNKNCLGVCNTGSTFHTWPTVWSRCAKHCSFVKPKGSTGCLWPSEQPTQQFYNLKKAIDLIEEANWQRGLKRGRSQQCHLPAHRSVLRLQPWFCHHPQICGRNHLIDHHWSAVQMHTNCKYTAEKPCIYSVNQSGAVCGTQDYPFNH